MWGRTSCTVWWGADEIFHPPTLHGWLVRGRLYMPGQRYELHHKICNLRYGTPGYGMSAYKGRWRQNAVILDVLWFANHKRAHLSEFHLWVLPLVTWIDGFSQPGYCMLHSLEQIKNRTDLFSGFWERPVLRKQTLRFQKEMSIGFWNHDGCFLSTAASDCLLL